MDDSALLGDLAPVAASLLDRHLGIAKEWFPHELVPWGKGHDFPQGEPVGLVEMSEGVRSALLVNLLTEDNLPYYLCELERLFGKHETWDVWIRRWTAEEGRHSIVIRDFVTVTRQLDPVELERARMAQVSGGVIPHPASAADGLCYLALQELATRVTHHNTGRALGEGMGLEVMKRVAADENLHYLFYRDAVTAALELDPSGTIEAIERQVVGFEMPGIGIASFVNHARAIAREGIYNIAVHFDSVLRPLVNRSWPLAALTGLSDSAEASRDRLFRFLSRLERVAARTRERQESRNAQPALA